MSKAYNMLMLEVGNMSKRQTTAVFDYVDELRGQIAALEAALAKWESSCTGAHGSQMQCVNVTLQNLKLGASSETAEKPDTIQHTDKPGGSLPWKCPVCGQLNSSWQTFCSGCTYDYAPKIGGDAS